LSVTRPVQVADKTYPKMFYLLDKLEKEDKDKKDSLKS